MEVAAEEAEPFGVPLATFDFEIAGRSWTIRAARDHDALLAASERFAQFPFGLLLWDSAPALAHVLAERPHLVRGRRVLELGAGAGLAGLVARHLGAEVVQTDHSPEALALCRLNARANGIEGVRLELADWNRWELAGRFDVILGADVLYDPQAVAPLAAVLSASLNERGVALLTDPKRAKASEAFAQLKEAGFDLVTTDKGAVTLLEVTRRPTT